MKTSKRIASEQELKIVKVCRNNAGIGETKYKYYIKKSLPLPIQSLYLKGHAGTSH